jgi:hypothetical protein
MTPDRRGNNRIDSLRNVLIDPRIALLFMIPGQGETLRGLCRARQHTMSLFGLVSQGTLQMSLQRLDEARWKAQ